MAGNKRRRAGTGVVIMAGVISAGGPELRVCVIGSKQRSSNKGWKNEAGGPELRVCVLGSTIRKAARPLTE